MFGNFGGLSEEKVNSFCQRLNGNNLWTPLTQSLSGTGYIYAKSTKDVLKIYFSSCKDCHISDEDAVEYLCQVLDRLTNAGKQGICREFKLKYLMSPFMTYI